MAYVGENVPGEDASTDTDLWQKTDVVKTNISMRKLAFAYFSKYFPDIEREYSGIGLGSNQCGTSHRSLKDGTDFGFGSGSAQLAHDVAYGTDAPRYLRALGVPMNITRCAVAGLVHADSSCVKELLFSDSLHFYGKEDAEGDDRATEAKRLDSTGTTLNDQNGRCHHCCHLENSKEY